MNPMKQHTLVLEGIPSLALCSQDQMANWWWQSIWQLSLDYHTKLGNKNVGAIVPPVFLSL